MVKYLPLTHEALVHPKKQNNKFIIFFSNVGCKWKEGVFTEKLRKLMEDR